MRFLFWNKFPPWWSVEFDISTLFESSRIAKGFFRPFFNKWSNSQILHFPYCFLFVEFEPGINYFHSKDYLRLRFQIKKSDIIEKVNLIFTSTHFYTITLLVYYFVDISYILCNIQWWCCSSLYWNFPGNVKNDLFCWQTKIYQKRKKSSETNILLNSFTAHLSCFFFQVSWITTKICKNLGMKSKNRI